jgi:hypothetical protein
MAPLRRLLIAAVFCPLAFAGYAQSSDWKSVRYGKITLRYPPTWHMNKEANGERTRVTLTPDSMQQLTMRMVLIYELPLGSDHSYESFKKDFPAMVRAQTDGETKFLKTDEITLKGHKCMYTEVIQNSLPVKVFGINGGTAIYAVVLLSRRYSSTPDPGMERDETAILNSISFDQ